MIRSFLLASLAGACTEAKPDATPDAPDLICIDEPDRLNLAWPLEGSEGSDWVTVNYVDLDPGPTLADYAGSTDGAAKTYDGHRGTDIGISSFRRMDQGINVIAAASGVVDFVIDGFDDRHTECVDHDANIVGVLHESGFRLQYLHLRANSTTVAEGDPVEAGDVLGQVGSSGCSDAPHLHFEITDPDGNWVDPFLEEMWCAAPVYDTPMQFMESWVLQGPDDLYDNPYQDPPTESAVFSVGDTLLAYMIVAGGLAGDTVAVGMTGPDESTIGPWTWVFEEDGRLTTWGWAFTVKEPLGEWTVGYRLNEEQAAEQEVEVR